MERKKKKKKNLFFFLIKYKGKQTLYFIYTYAYIWYTQYNFANFWQAVGEVTNQHNMRCERGRTGGDSEISMVLHSTYYIIYYTKYYNCIILYQVSCIYWISIINTTRYMFVQIFVEVRGGVIYVLNSARRKKKGTKKKKNREIQTSQKNEKKRAPTRLCFASKPQPVSHTWRTSRRVVANTSNFFHERHHIFLPSFLQEIQACSSELSVCFSLVLMWLMEPDVKVG